MSSFLETKQQTQATTIENLRLETGWKFNALLIKETECTFAGIQNIQGHEIMPEIISEQLGLFFWPFYRV